MAIIFKPSLFHDFNPNIRIKGYYRTFFILIIPALIIAWIIYGVMGIILDSVVENITPAQEQWLWQQIRIPLKIEEHSYKVKKKLTHHIQRVFRKIPIDVLPYHYDYKVYVVKDDEANAFAAPGGNIIVTDSLMKEINNEDVLLFVLCHELGHFQNRDHLKQYGRNLVLTQVVKWIFGAGIGALVARSALIYRHDYSRQEEYAADRWGAYLLYKTKKNLNGALQFMEWASHVDETPLWQEFFSTHPSSHNRTKRIIEMLPGPVKMPRHPLIHFGQHTVHVGKKILANGRVRTPHARAPKTQ
ncbi:MAG: M48 family metallopeptidase [Alphaproteobacteria bacterium]|nr:MAG: M48 family metallopeptidase [Alphaproteobacteria bacterium]